MTEKRAKILSYRKTIHHGLAVLPIAVFRSKIMILNCPACKTRYLVPDSAIGAEGRSVRCASCRHSWFQEGVLPETLATAMPPPVSLDNKPAAAAMTSSPAGFAAPEMEKPAPPSAPLPSFVSEQSSFAHEPPFKPRRNPAKLWTMAAIIFAAVMILGGGLLYAFGSPSWMQSYQFASVDETPLLIELPRNQERRTLPDGTELFAASGTIINPTDTQQTVPPMLVVLRDASGRVVYSWQMKPPVKTLAPGGKTNFNEAKLDIPRAAANLEVGWADQSRQ